MVRASFRTWAACGSVAIVVAAAAGCGGHHTSPAASTTRTLTSTVTSSTAAAETTTTEPTTAASTVTTLPTAPITATLLPPPPLPITTTVDPVPEITAAYLGFFSGNTTADQKIALVQNGQAFAATIRAQNATPIAKSTTATVGQVTVTGPSSANVTFTVSLGGVPALQNQPGTAIVENGRWKVSAATFCALLTMEGNPPPICGAR